MNFNRHAAKVMIALLFLGYIRGVVLVAHEPMIGYGNSYDMIRIMELFGIYPQKDQKIYKEATPERPIRLYVMTKERHLSYLSSGIFLVAPIYVLSAIRCLAVHQELCLFDLKKLGLFSILVLLFICLSLCFLFYNFNVKIGVLFSFLAALFIFDPVNTLYANTLYLEFSSVVGLLMSLGLVVYLDLRRPRRFHLWLVAAGALLFLGLSKHQHFLFPLFLAVALGLNLLIQKALDKRTAILFLATIVPAVLLPPLFQGLIGPKFNHSASINLCNATDTVFGTILPELSNPERGLRLLGLPEKCKMLIGKNWYTEGVQQNHACPEVGRVSKVRYLLPFIYEPGAYLTMLGKGLSLSMNWLPRYLGQIAETNMGRIDIRLSSRFFSLATIFEKMSVNSYLFLSLLSFFAFPFIVLIQRVSNLGQNQVLSWLLATIYYASVSVFYVVNSALFGDGYLGADKHMHLLQTLIPIILANLLIAIFLASKNIFMRYRRSLDFARVVFLP